MIDEFRTEGYQRHNRARQEHLASLGLPLENRTVLELGAGIGDHTQFWLDRGCQLTCVEARPDNAMRIWERYCDRTPLPVIPKLPWGLSIVLHDLTAPCFVPGLRADIVYAYGILYHLANPAAAISQWAAACKDLLLLETCVDPGPDCSIRFVPDNPTCPTGSYNGTGCRPTRAWVMTELRRWFSHVYVPITQPDHEEFPGDWMNISTDGLIRAVFVACSRTLENPLLTQELPIIQERMEL